MRYLKFQIHHNKDCDTSENEDMQRIKILIETLLRGIFHFCVFYESLIIKYLVRILTIELKKTTINKKQIKPMVMRAQNPLENGIIDLHDDHKSCN